MPPPKDPLKYEEWKDKISKTFKNKTYEEMYGIEKANEIRKKIRDKLIGKSRGPRSDEWRKNLSKSCKGKIISEDARRKMSETLKGRISPMKGRIHSEETRKKMRESSRHLSMSQQAKEKLSSIYKEKTFEERYGKERAEQIKKKISLINKGKQAKNKNPMYGRRGINSPGWKGGISNKPYTYDFNKRFKEKIKQRDNFVCQLCNLYEEDALKLYNKVLTIHHIDYDKTNSFFQNCVTLCLRCNSLVNKDREIWTKHFQELLKKLYQYEYTQDQKIILDWIGGNNE